MKLGMRIIKSIMAVAISFLISFILILIDNKCFNKAFISLWFNPLICAVVAMFSISNNKKRQALVTAKLAYVYSVALLVAFIIDVVMNLSLTSDIIMTDKISLNLVFLLSLYICGGLIIILLLLPLLKAKEYLASVILLYIIFVGVDVIDLDPFAKLGANVLSLGFGLLISYLINIFRPWHHKHKEYLFVYGIDGNFTNTKDTIFSPSMRFQLNTLVDTGANITYFSTRPPANLANAFTNVNLTMPVFCMNGAVLYDFKNECYLETYPLSQQATKDVFAFCQANAINPFCSVIRSDMHYIYIKKVNNIGELTYYDYSRNNKYSNFILGEEVKGEIIYLSLVVKRDAVEEILQKMHKLESYNQIYVTTTDFTKFTTDASDYTVIKIYSSVIATMPGLNNIRFSNLKKIGLSSADSDLNLINASDYKICIDSSSKEIINKCQKIIKAKNAESLVMEIKYLYYRKSSY